MSRVRQGAAASLLAPRPGPGQPIAARRLAWFLGFCLPLSGGLTLSQWIPEYPDQLTPIRLVTFASLAWLVTARTVQPLPIASKRMIWALLGALVYAVLSLIWAPDVTHGIHDLITVGMALATGIALLLLVRCDGRTMGNFVAGLLLAGGLQVGLAVVEVTIGYHVSSGFGALYLEQWGLSSVEAVYGSVAWGTMGNPNDLSGFLLILTAVFLSVRAYGLQLRRGRLVLGFATTAVAIWIGLTALADSRAFRLGLVALIGMHLIDRLLTPSRTALRVPVTLLLGWAALALALLKGGSIIHGITDAGASDALRLKLVSEGLGAALLSGGFGRGLGAEKASLDAGEITTNLHNILATLLMEFGFLVAAAFVTYLLVLLLSWAFVTRSARAIGAEAALARATLAVALLIYGVTSSGVIESPVYWTFFAATALLSISIQGPGAGWSLRRS